MANLYDNAGNLMVHDDSKPCELCGHYDGNKAGVGVHPALIMLQAFGGVLAGISLAIVNIYMLPEYTWVYQETAFIAVFIMMPSVALWLILFGLQILGLHEAWIKLVIWIIGGSMISVLFMWGIDELLKIPSLTGGAS